MLVFRSILIPIKAALLNLLSITAALGAMTLVFQHGLFGVQPASTGKVITAAGAIMIVVFGAFMST